MKTLKIPLATYVNLRDKVKFLEYYWYLYTTQNPQPESYPHYAEISTFINSDFYEGVSFIKLHKFTNRVTVTRRLYQQLKRYATISDELLASLKPLNLFKPSKLDERL